jgi:hypothetical protein
LDGGADGSRNHGGLVRALSSRCSSGLLSSGDGTFTAFVAFTTSGTATSSTTRTLIRHRRGKKERVDFGAEEA